MSSKFVFATAQRPFETNGIHFCTLVPICTIEGEPVDRTRDFPSAGLCWFMLRDVRFQGLTPGQLVVGPIEETKDYLSSNPDKHWYQLKFDMAQIAGTSDTVLEVVDAGPELPDGPRALIAPSFELSLTHCPTTLVIVRYGNNFYGPFRTNAREDDYSGAYGGWKVALERPSKNKIVKADRAVIDRAGGFIETRKLNVSLEDDPPERARFTLPLSYTLLPWRHFERLRQSGATELELLTDAEILSRAAKDHLKPKAKRQQLIQLMKELETALQGLNGKSEEVARSTAARLSNSLQSSDQLAEFLTKTIIDSGFLDDQIKKWNEHQFQAHLQSRAAEVESLISERTKEASARYSEIALQADQLDATIRDRKEQAFAEMETELSDLRRTAEDEVRLQRSQIDAQTEALRREQGTIADTIAAAAERFGAGRKELLSDFFALMPALQEVGIFGPQVPQKPITSHPESTTGSVVGIPLPAPFTADPQLRRGKLDEVAFFERFASHVEASGFRYREVDLKTFHLLVKTCDLTVLAGLSGTGKSSLVRLYTEAIAGEDQSARRRFLTIDVSPSWTEPNDLLGNVNLLDHRFEASGAGLFYHLVAAAREYESSGNSSGLVFVALDEMNLAQVEHYFAGFIQALERSSPRMLAVYDPGALKDGDPLRAFGRLNLPPTLRFVGTVNFDETTRPLSQRLKDRAAIIELGSERHSGFLQADHSIAVHGRPVMLSDFEAWVSARAQVPTAIAAFLDELSPILSAMGSPITARRSKAIQKLFQAAAPLLSSEQALDIAVSTRILPMLRGFDTVAARRSGEHLMGVLAKAPGGCPVCLQQLETRIELEKQDWTVDPDDEL